MARVLLASLSLLLCLAVGCDRRIEPYDPDEAVAEPDLSKIFPEGAERTAERESPPAGAPSASGGRGAPPVAPGGAAPAAAAAGEPIRGTLVLAPELAGRVPPGGVLFVVARNPGGGPPVAVKRIPDPRFPMAFELGPDDRMIQAIPFAGPLQISARVDGDGNATSREPGDLAGEAETPVDPGARDVVITIDELL